jgi:hypothetical protein
MARYAPIQRTQERVRRNASAELAVSRHGVSASALTRWTRKQDGQRTRCSDRSGWMGMRAPQQGHTVLRRLSCRASRITWVNRAPPVIAKGKLLIADLSDALAKHTATEAAFAMGPGEAWLVTGN